MGGKGKDLELAVKAIEEVVFRNQPELRGRKIDVVANRRFKHVGAGHEVDLFITVDAGTAAEERHAYECKNRNEPTEKDDVIVFRYKVDALGAKSGTMISRRFTSGAKAIAASEPRIRLVEFTQEFTTILDEVQWVAFSVQSLTAPTDITFRDAWATAMPLYPNIPAVLAGRRTTFRQVVDALADAEMATILKVQHNLPEGIHAKTTRYEEFYGPMDLLIGGCEVMRLHIALPYLIYARVAQLHAKFSVDGRGAAYWLDWTKDPFGGKSYSLEIITKPIPRSA